MEAHERQPDQSEKFILSADELLAMEKEQVGTAADYVRVLAICLEADDNYCSNLLQLQRMARLVTASCLSENTTSGVQIANGFYWGEIIGLTAGDRFFGSTWAQVVYDNVNSYFLGARELVAEGEIDSVVESDRQLFVAQERQLVTDTADFILGSLEDENQSSPVPQRYVDLIESWANDLSEDEEVKYYIEMGFKFMMKFVVDEYDYVQAREVERFVTENIGESIDWAELANNDGDPNAYPRGNN